MVLLKFGGDDDAVYTTEIKDQRSSRYRERDQKAVVHFISLGNIVNSIINVKGSKEILVD